MDLKSAVRDAALGEIKRMRLSIGLYTSARNVDIHNLLAYLHKHQIIDDASIEGALEEVVFAEARNDYNFLTRRNNVAPYKIWADHVGRPECLAYALQKGQFTDREIRKIPFDHGETAQTFTATYGRQNLLATLREELLNPKPLPDFGGDYDPHPACCG